MKPKKDTTEKPPIFVLCINSKLNHSISYRQLLNFNPILLFSLSIDIKFGRGV